MARKPATFSMINTLRARYYKSVSGKESLICILNEAEVPEHVYNSNAIENSTLTLEETEKILLAIDLDRYVSEREIFEAKNLARVVAYTDARASEADMSLDLMRLLHKMLLGNIREDVAGRFRGTGEWVRVGTHIGADPAHIESLLTDMLTEFRGRTDAHIVERLARLHLTFESIHPFVDGNGRMGRVLNNYLLIREGYVPINIAFVNRVRYYDAFKEYDSHGHTAIMQELVGRALTQSYHKRLAYLEGKDIIPLARYAKEHKQSHAALINKAKRQTIEAFMEKGVWKIARDARTTR